VEQSLRRAPYAAKTWRCATNSPFLDPGRAERCGARAAKLSFMILTSKRR
jgi:hypothetical protein